jgi:hypothetical protein
MNKKASEGAEQQSNLVEEKSNRHPGKIYSSSLLLGWYIDGVV